MIFDFIIIAMLLAGWAWVANTLLSNFEKDLATLPTGRKIALICVLVIFAPIFFCEGMLEIIVDIIIDGEEE